MSKDIRQLTKAGVQFYPQTHIAGLVGYGQNGRAIDDEPTEGSGNLVKSMGVEKQNRISQLLTLDTTGNNVFDKNYIRANKIVRNQSPFDIYTFEGAVTTSFYKVPSTCQVITVGGLVASGTISWRLSKDVTDDAESISGFLSVGSLTSIEITPERREYPYFCATIYRGSDTPNLSDVFISFGDRFRDVIGSGVPDIYDSLIFSESGYIDWSTGVVTSSGYHSTQMIKVTPGTVVTMSHYAGSSLTAAVAAYDSNNDYIQEKSIAGGSVDTVSYTVPSRVDYIRLCVNNSALESISTSILLASPFVTKGEDTTNNINDTEGKVPDIKLIKVIALGEKYNNEELTNTGYFASVLNGGYLAHVDFVSSNYLPCKAGDQYLCLFCAVNNAGVCFYDSSKQYLNEYWQSNGSDYQVFKVPDNAAFMRLSNRVTVVAEPEFRLINDQYNDLATLTRKVSILEEIISSIETGFYKSIIRLYPQQKLPCVSFQFDDIPAQDDAIVNLFDTYKLTCAFAFIASEANVMAKSKKYKELQHRGYQIMNHSIDGLPFNTTNYSYDTALAAIRTALYRIQDAGMVCNGFVAPSSTMAPSFMPILRMFHAYAFTSSTTSPTANGRNQDTCDLHRYSIQSNTIADIKQFIDDCITNDQIVTFYGHAANLIAGDESVWSINKIKSIIEYCLNKRDSGLLYVGNTDDCVKYYFDL